MNITDDLKTDLTAGIQHIENDLNHFMQNNELEPYCFNLSDYFNILENRLGDIQHKKIVTYFNSQGFYAKINNALILFGTYILTLTPYNFGKDVYTTEKLARTNNMWLGIDDDGTKHYFRYKPFFVYGKWTTYSKDDILTMNN